MRLIVQLQRDIRAAYISHLDLQRTMGRALRRAGLPLRYSEGFNPHPVLSFALAVPVGVLFKENWMDIALIRDVFPEEALPLLQNALPPGLAAVAAHALPDAAPALMPLVTAADYSFCFEDLQQEKAFKTKLNEILAKEMYVIEKKTKSGRKPVDVRPWILYYNEETVRLTAGNTGGLNPRLLLADLCGMETKAEITLLALHSGTLSVPQSLLFNKSLDTLST